MKKTKELRKLNELSNDEMVVVVNFINDCLEVKRNIKNLQSSFNETLGDFCEERELDKKALRKVINLVYKMKEKDDDVIDEEQEILDLISKISNKL